MKSKLEVYYKLGLWQLHRLRKAVECGWLSEEEFEKIVGESYERAGT